MRYSILVFFISISIYSYSQNDTISSKININFSGFLDVFYAYDFNEPKGLQRQSFLYNHNRHNEFNVNLAYFKLEINELKYRANLAFHTGTYVSDNYKNEINLLKNINEANIGLSLNNKNNLWLDAGVFPSHIGFESAISSDNLTLTRSLSAENSPYFFGGAKLSYLPNSKLQYSFLILNGWQRIQRLQGNSLPSFGSQIKYSNSHLTLNWSSFMGTDYPDFIRRIRYFNNFYAQWSNLKKWNLIVGLDLGAEQKVKGSSDFNWWFSPTLITQYQLCKNWKTAYRLEYYSDRFGVIVPLLNNKEFKTLGFSVNLDYCPNPKLLARIEARWLNNKDMIFERNNNYTSNNVIITSSLSVKFN